VFNELRRLGQWTRPNPLVDVRQFKTNERELTYLTHDQIDKLLDALAESRNVHALPIARLCLATGGRWGETEALRSTQVRGGVVQFANATKSKRARAVPIAKQLQAEVDAHAKKHGDGQRIFGPAYGVLLEAMDRAELSLPKGQASHVLRHTFASRFMMAGGNIIALQRILGHQSLAMTMRYAHLSPDHLQEAVNLNPLACRISRRNSVGRRTAAHSAARI
jgi:integrase